MSRVARVRNDTVLKCSSSRCSAGASPLADLWAAHDAALACIASPRSGRLPASLLHIKAEIAWRLLGSCVLCEHRCGANRTAAERGVCGVSAITRLYFAGLLVTEEPEISPSFCVFPSGCNFRCAFCCVREENAHPKRGMTLSAGAVNAWLALPENALAGTLSFIGGEPTVHLPALLAMLVGLRSSLPVVWNSNFYFSSESARLLDGLVEVYVADFHYGSDECAARLAGARDHFAVVTRNLLWAAERGHLIVRHLVIPGHMNCCTRPILEWAAAHLNVPVNVMCNYVPPAGGASGDLGRPLTVDEARDAIGCARELGLRLVTGSLASANRRS